MNALLFYPCYHLVMAALYLIPNTLGSTRIDHVLPAAVADIVGTIRHYIVEDVRTARRFLRLVDHTIDIDSLTFYELNGHTPAGQVASFLTPLIEGHDMGVISEAGCPAIADPGADVVALAQQHGLRVVPMVGPSSILLALMASGFNGQNFAFNGYLPIRNPERSRCLRRLEARAHQEHQSQLFIETPYRNRTLVEDMLHTLQPQTMLCIATDITLETEQIRTLSIGEWCRTELPDLNKRPTIFIIY